MDLQEVIRELRLERDQLTNAIASLEALQLSILERQKLRSTRGRTFMNEKERKAVSERMKRFWEGRKLERQAQERGAAPSSAGTADSTLHFTAA